MENPHFIYEDQKNNLNIAFEGRSFYSNRLGELLKDQVRFKDICGEKIGAVMSCVGWEMTDHPTAASAYVDGVNTPIGCAWCTPIEWHDGRLGVNISYAVDKRYEGLGLSKVLTCVAFNIFKKENQDYDAEINIQCDVENLASAKVALSMGFQPAVGNNFTVPNENLSYIGFTSPSEEFMHYARNLIADRLTQAMDISKVLEGRDTFGQRSDYSRP